MDEKIKSLSPKDEVRKKINVWLDSNTHKAVVHTVKELVGNSADMINNKNGDTITIIRHDRYTLTVSDNCSGLPVEGMGKKEIEGVGVVDIPNYQLLTAHLFAGTKYDNGIDGNNFYTVGTNGVFLTVLSRSSEFVNFEVGRPSGNVYSFAYKKGDEVEPLTVIGKTDKTYTKITYKLDNDVFLESDNYFSLEELCEIAEQQSSLIDGTIIVIDEESGQTFEYHFENGFTELFEKYTSEKSMILDEPIVFNRNVTKYNETTKVDDNMIIDMVLSYSKEEEGLTQIEFLNGSNLIEHGTIYDGMVAGLRRALDKYCKDKDLYKKGEKPLRVDDCTMGLNYVIKFKSFFPAYTGQTKFATQNPYYYDIMKDIMENEFEVLTLESPKVVEQIAKQVLLNKRSRENSENNRQKVKRELEGKANTIASRPNKFVPCRSKDKTKKRITLIEGDSALNAVKQARDKMFDAIFPLKGKPMNCLKKTIDEIMKNEEIRNIAKLLGCGVTYKGKGVKGLPKFNIEDIQFCEIDILSDGDEDGFHIRCLLIVMFYVLMEEVIINEMLKIIEAPLYRITTKEKIKIDGVQCLESSEIDGYFDYIAYDEIERSNIISNIKGKYEETRFKGLGGLNPQLSASTIMSMEDRRVKVVTMEDVQECIRVLEMFLDDDNSDRKDFIKENGHKYFDYSIYED